MGKSIALSDEKVISKIFILRGKKVMLDKDLAELYGIETKQLKRQVRLAMLSSILNSKTAIEVNIQIMRVFTRMRELTLTHKDMLLKLEQLEKKSNKHDEEIQLIFSYLKKLLNPSQPARRRIGYKTD